MLVRFLLFASSTMKSKMDSIPTASVCNELLLPPHKVDKCTPPAVDRTQPRLSWCICFTDPTDTAIEYLSLLCALSTPLIVVTI